MKSQLRIAGVNKQSIVDGLGIRYTIYTQGCRHNCKGCHNPQTHKFGIGEIADTQSIAEEIITNPLIKGITLSGGEPFEQASELICLVKLVKSKGKDVWAYSGYLYEQLNKDVTTKSSELLELVDVLVDGKYDENLRDLTLTFRGSSNQRVIDCNQTKEKNQIVLLDL